MKKETTPAVVGALTRVLAPKLCGAAPFDEQRPPGRDHVVDSQRECRQLEQDAEADPSRNWRHEGRRCPTESQMESTRE